MTVPSFTQWGNVQWYKLKVMKDFVSEKKCKKIKNYVRFCKNVFEDINIYKTIKKSSVKKRKLSNQ